MMSGDKLILAGRDGRRENRETFQAIHRAPTRIYQSEILCTDIKFLAACASVARTAYV